MKYDGEYIKSTGDRSSNLPDTYQTYKSGTTA